MNLKEGRSGKKEAAAATMLALLASGLFALESHDTYALSNGVYLASALAAIIAWLIFEALSTLCIRLCAESLADLLARVSGRFLGKLLGLCLVFLLLYVSAQPLYHAAIDQVNFVYTGADFTAVLCYIAPCLLLLVLLGLEAILRTSRMFLWLSMLSLLLMLVYAAPQFQSYRLFPILGGGMGELIGQTGKALLRFLPPLLALLIVGQGVHGIRHARKSGRMALLMALPLVLAIQLGEALSYYHSGLAGLSAPLYQIVEVAQINQPGMRLDRLLIFFWVLPGVLGTAYYLYAASLLFCRCFALRDIRPVGALMVGISATLALLHGQSPPWLKPLADWCYQNLWRILLGMVIFLMSAGLLRRRRVAL